MGIMSQDCNNRFDRIIDNNRRDLTDNKIMNCCLSLDSSNQEEPNGI